MKEEEEEKVVQSYKTMHKIPRQKKTKPNKFNSCENKHSITLCWFNNM